MKNGYVTLLDGKVTVADGESRYTVAVTGMFQNHNFYCKECLKFVFFNKI